MSSAQGIIERTCPECGKNFIVPIPEVYAYRAHGEYLCSYTCKNAYSKKTNRHLSKRYRGKDAVDIDAEKISKMLYAKGMNAYELQRKYGFGYSTAYSFFRMERTRVKMDMAQRIADALGVPVDEIVKKHK